MILSWLLIAVVTAAATEAGLTAWVAHFDAHASVGQALLAGLLASTIDLLVALPVALLVGWLGSGSRPKALYDGLVGGLTGDPDAKPLGTLSLLIIPLPFAYVALVFAGQFIETFSPRFAALGAVLVTLFALLSGLVAAAQIAPRLAKLAGGPRARVWSILSAFVWIGAAVAMSYWVIATFSPKIWAPVVSVLAITLVCAYTPLGRVLLHRRAPLVAMAVLVVLVVASAASLGQVDASTRKLLSDHAYYATTATELGKVALDRDKDSHLPPPFGVDCDNGNPSIEPDARDIPGNGIDENCSGEDAVRWSEPVAKKASLPEGVPSGKPIVMLFIDTLRPDHTGLAGYERNTTPNLDKFREEATWFPNAYTQAPTTKFPLGSIFVGRDIRTSKYRMSETQYHMHLDRGVDTLAERLGKRGYDSVGWTLRWVMDFLHDFNQGFRKFGMPYARRSKTKRSQVPVITSDKAIEYLEQRDQEALQPYFLFVHYGCPHFPYVRVPEFDFGRSPIDRYDSSVAQCDSEVARVLKAIEAQADGDQTSIFVFSDHGEGFGEHGVYKHGYALLESQIRVLLLAKIPGFEERTVERAVSLTDVGYTAALLGGNQFSPHSSARSLLSKESEPERDIFIYTDMPPNYQYKKADGVLRYPWKLVRDRQSGLKELFHVERDPNDSTNMIEDEPELAAELMRRLDSYTAYAPR